VNIRTNWFQTCSSRVGR